MRIVSRARRAAALLVVAAALLPAPPAGATEVEQQCHEVGGARVCVAADTGLYEPVYVECHTPTTCWARVTVGHEGSGGFDGSICFGEPGTEPACAGVGPAEITLVYVEPRYMCFNDSPWGPPCAPREVDEQ